MEDLVGGGLTSLVGRGNSSGIPFRVRPSITPGSLCCFQSRSEPAEFLFLFRPIVGPVGASQEATAGLRDFFCDKLNEVLKPNFGHY
jgi:hypothetical protein